MTNLNNIEHMRQLIQLVESHENNGLAEAIHDAYTQDQLEDIKKQIIDYRKEGLTDREISQRMGKTNLGWVTNIVGKRFPDLRKQTMLGLAVTDLDKTQMAQEFQKGNLTIKQLAKTHGVSRDAVQRWLEAQFGQQEVARLQALYRKPNRNWTQEEKDWAADQYRQGTGPLAIAAIFMKNIDTQPPGTEEMTPQHISDMLRDFPNYRELQSQFKANKNLHREPEPFTTTIYPPGTIDPQGRKTDWRVGRGYK